jgi:hypothetical protein
MPAARGSRSLRNIETRKKKARRTIPRVKAQPLAGNTLGARVRAKKLAGQKRAAKAKAAGAGTTAG